MDKQLTATTGHTIEVIVCPDPLDHNPAAVYLAGLSGSSRRTMRQALDAIAAMVAQRRDATGEATRLRVLSQLEVCRLWYEYAGDVCARLEEELAPLRAKLGEFSSKRKDLLAQYIARQISQDEQRRKSVAVGRQAREVEGQAEPLIVDLNKACTCREVALIQARRYVNDLFTAQGVIRSAAHAAGVEAARQAQATIVSIEPYLSPGPRAA